MPPLPIRAVTSYGPRREPGARAMLDTVSVGLFYRQLVSRVRTTAGQDSRGRGLLQTGCQTRTCALWLHFSGRWVPQNPGLCGQKAPDGQRPCATRHRWTSG